MSKLLKALFILMMIPATAFAQDAAQEPAPAAETLGTPVPAEAFEPQTQQAAPAQPQQGERFEPPPPKEMTHIYSPEHCDFTIGFPEEPVVTNKCDGGINKNECYDQVFYTQTFNLDATVNFRVICNKIGQDIKDKYNKDIMQATLKEMTKNSVVETIQTTYHEDEQNRYRIAGLVAEGKVGLVPSIFIAQMWLGQNSAFSVEAEMIGDAYIESDALFRDIMRSISYKDELQDAIDAEKKAMEEQEKAQDTAPAE